MVKKQVLSAFVALGIIVGSGAQAFAEPLTNAQKQEIQQKQDEYKKAEAKLQELENTLQSMDNQIEKILGDIDKNKKDIEKVQEKIKVLQKEMDKTKKELKEKQDVFDTRMIAIYKSGSPGYFETIISAKGFSDLISKIKAVGKLMEFDKKIVDELNGKKKELDEKKSGLDIEVARLSDLKKVNENKLADLNNKKKEQEKVIAQVKEENKKVQVDVAAKERLMIEFPKSIINNSNSSVSDIQSAIETLREIRKKIIIIDKEVVDIIEKGKDIVAKKKAAAASLSRGGAPMPGSSNSILNYAYRFMGTPYRWGGTTPSGFDCSGFTSYVFGAFGYGIGRDTGAQLGSGSSVSYSELQPGDLVFTNGGGHVGIYVGGGQYIHSPHTGDVVKVSSIHGFYAGRRVLR